MVRYQLFRDTESSDNMVKEETGSCVSFTIEGRHGFRPFCEIIDGDNDVLMAVCRRGSTLHEVNSPLAKGTNSDYGV